MKRRKALTAAELARLAGYTIHPVDSGGLWIQEELRLMHVGPDADELEILRAALHHLMGVASARPPTDPSARESA